MVKKIAAVSVMLPFALALFAMPALADNDDEGNVYVENTNVAVVVNQAGSAANTGGNLALGSYGGDGGDGGDIYAGGGECDDCDEVEESHTGNGGNGGNGGLGGTVVTGDANANTKVINKVNYNETNIDRCGCDDPEGGDVEGDDYVGNVNVAFVANSAGSLANTGLNLADGSYGGNGGNGGDISSSGGEVEESGTGDGGQGGEGSDGGFVLTGVANSETKVVNIVNKNVTWIRR
jgi:hypothetical protein